MTTVLECKQTFTIFFQTPKSVSSWSCFLISNVMLNNRDWVIDRPSTNWLLLSFEVPIIISRQQTSFVKGYFSPEDGFCYFVRFDSVRRTSTSVCVFPAVVSAVVSMLLAISRTKKQPFRRSWIRIGNGPNSTYNKYNKPELVYSTSFARNIKDNFAK